MSDATRKAMVEAIGAHAADIMDGAFLMDWVLVGYVPRFGAEKAESSNYYIDSSTAADHVARGLLGVGLASLDGQVPDIDE